MDTFNTVLTFQSLKQNYYDRLLIYFQGGTWRATPEFVAWVYCQLQQNPTSLIAVDAAGEPWEITNVQEFFQTLNNHLHEENIKYFGDYVKLQKQINQEWRQIKDLELENDKK